MRVAYSNPVFFSRKPDEDLLRVFLNAGQGNPEGPAGV
jgi:hypothetical protein